MTDTPATPDEKRTDPATGVALDRLLRHAATAETALNRTLLLFPDTEPVLRDACLSAGVVARIIRQARDTALDGLNRDRDRDEQARDDEDGRP